jgi:hypothetical protein
MGWIKAVGKCVRDVLLVVAMADFLDDYILFDAFYAMV